MPARRIREHLAEKRPHGPADRNSDHDPDQEQPVIARAAGQATRAHPEPNRRP
ncbi:hypothetical protein [Streptacidiphilus sp. EB103A]|uniref:hypothetical protein n=1 Tax=Streptacidiphilus sp. EB103A TaxID=3156275 RepID=UPI003514F999